MSSPARPWIMIPARGGSRGVPRKNVRLLGGVPLIARAVRTALAATDPGRVIVITDDDEIEAIALREGATSMREERTTGLATLDDVALKVAVEIERRGGVTEDVFLTLQPTCPFLTSHRIDEAVAAFEAGAGSVLTVVDDRHLSWTIDAEGKAAPKYTARVNRQQLAPEFRETGGVIGCRLGDLRIHRTRIIQPISLVTVTRTESLDIDEFTDWAVAEYLVSRRRVVIRADASSTMGMGHAYRALALAQEFARHKVVIVTDANMPMGAMIFNRHPFEVVEVDGPSGFFAWLEENPADLVILDQLDTTEDYVRAVRPHTGKLVTFEDLGAGAALTDLVVSDLYQNLNVPDDRQLTGIANAILAPNFETDMEPAPFRTAPERILIVFGGTDPAHLTEKTLEALGQVEFPGEITVIVGPGVKRDISLETYGLRGEMLHDVTHMPGVMRRVDMAVSSAGRTVTELVSLGLPVLCLCQNEKELTHTHAAARFGVINLGLGELVGVDTLAAHIGRLTTSVQLRTIMRARALHETAGRSNAAVIERIARCIGWN